MTNTMLVTWTNTTKAQTFCQYCIVIYSLIICSEDNAVKKAIYEKKYYFVHSLLTRVNGTGIIAPVANNSGTVFSIYILISNPVNSLHMEKRIKNEESN
ncbi:hypothetical protein PT300_01260 [Enterobacteriaceae bacterium ESL0689]|nr:hypothetical protein [Enterobacteriaceae bacterium ESL0689]